MQALGRRLAPSPRHRRAAYCRRYHPSAVSITRAGAGTVPRLHPPSPSTSLRRGDGGRMRRPARMRPPALGSILSEGDSPVQPPRSKRAGLVTISLPIQPSAEAGGANYTWMHTHAHEDDRGCRTAPRSIPTTGGCPPSLIRSPFESRPRSISDNHRGAAGSRSSRSRRDALPASGASEVVERGCEHVAVEAVAAEDALPASGRPQHGSRRSRSRRCPACIGSLNMAVDAVAVEVAAGWWSRGAAEHMAVEVEDVLIVISEYLPVIVVVLLVY